MAIGADDYIAVPNHWPAALIDVSRVSAFLFGSAAAFLPLVRSR